LDNHWLRFNGRPQRWSVVLCPAHLCDQWERELRQKFAIDAALLRPSSVARLRELPRQDLSIYEHYPHLIASIDFVKAERHRGPFWAPAPIS
jgi:hypothetical protein